MKYCPVCQTRYDEEIMRFCTKDGTPLIDEAAPNFTEIPSEDSESNEDDFGADTVVRRKNAESEITNVEPRMGETSQRMVIPTAEPPPEEQPQVRAKQVSYQSPPPRKTNTATVVLLTVLGTIIVLGGGLGIYWLMSGKKATVANSNSNLNANQDTNLNTNLNIGNTLFNINSDVNANANIDININANSSPTPSPTKTPSPSPTRTPMPSPTPSPTPDEDNNSNTGNTNSGGAPVNTRPTPTPTPRPSPSQQPTKNPANVGNMNSRAVSLSKPAYPPIAKQMRAGGQVPVQIMVDETGKVMSAKAIGGHPLLRQAAENAARQSRFSPVRVSGQAVKSVGTVVYNFVGN